MNTATDNADASLAIVFPGQGSQSVGMLSELAASFPLVNETFTQASDALGYDLWKLTRDGPKDELNRTDRTQPAMLAAGVAVWRVWQQENGMLPVWPDTASENIRRWSVQVPWSLRMPSAL
jgi:[acyl-carrier-protein] S-malonyltransferase